MNSGLLLVEHLCFCDALSQDNDFSVCLRHLVRTIVNVPQALKSRSELIDEH